MNNKIVLVGGGDFSKKIIRLIKKIGGYEIIGYTDILDSGDLFGVPYLGEDSCLEKVIYDYPACKSVICIGGNLRFTIKKKEIVSNLINLGFSFPKLISPNAEIDETAEIGQGVVIFDRSYIDFGVKIGDYSVINMNTTIGHDTRIGNFVTISPETITGGGSEIGNFTFIGMNTTVLPYIKINKECIIGAGSVVTKDINVHGYYVGNPAKKIK